MLKLISMNTLGLLVLRLGLAILVIYQGSEKITRAGTKWGAAWHYTGPPPPPALFAGPNPAAPPEHLPAAVQLVISWGQVVCGIALALGAFTRWAAAALIVLRVGGVAIFALQDRFSFPE